MILALIVKLGAGNFVKTSGTAHRMGTESTAGRTPDVNGDHARELGRTDKLGPLPKQDGENVKQFDIERSIDHWTKVRDLRQTLIQYLLQQNRFGTGENKTIEKKEMCDVMQEACPIGCFE